VRCNRARVAPHVRHGFPTLPCSNQTIPCAHTTAPHHCHLLWPKDPFGPNQPSGSAHTPPSSHPLFIFMSLLCPSPGTPRGAGEAEVTAMAVGSEVGIIDLFVLAKHISDSFSRCPGHFGQGYLP